MSLRLDKPTDRYQAGESFRPTIDITRGVLPTAIRHGCELWWDGSTPTKRLDTRNDRDGFTRFVNARIEGKLAEVAFKQFLEEYYGIYSQVDWRIYGDYQTTDEGDLEYILDNEGNEHTPSVEFDVKKTKPYNQWLAIREEIFTQIDDDAPVILTKLSIQDDIELEEWSNTGDWRVVDEDDRFRDRLLEFADGYFPLSVELVGTAYKHEFTDEFEKGDRLYDPDSGAQLGGPLKRNNQGIHVTNLYNSAERWNEIVTTCVEDIPCEINPLPVVDQ